MPDDRRAQELRRLLFAGRHREIVERTLDSADGQVGARELAYVVGALALLGRIDEALACGESAPFDRALAAEEAIEVDFFLVVGLCHAGRYEEATRMALRNLRRARSLDDQRVRFFVSQGAAMLRYFGGRVTRALFWAKRALAASVAARFNYGRLLALDLWGHVLVQRGDISAGLRTLGQAERLATSLSYAGHATSIACSRLAYQSRHGRGGTDLEEALMQITVDSTDNLYALRSAWLELAFHAAIHGDALRARDALDRAEAQAVPEQDERAHTRLLLTTAILRRLDHSLAAARIGIREADAAAERAGDQILRAEVRCWDLVLGTEALVHDAPAASRLRRESGSFAAQCLDALHQGHALDPLTAQGSPLWSLLVRKDLDARARAELALRHGWLGLSVMVLGGEPGKRLWLLEDGLLADNHGMVVHAQKAPRHTLQLLRVLAEGEQSKPDLIGRIWHVRKYSPAHHDAVIYTAIARMRRSLGTSSDWIRTSALGYLLAPGVSVHDLASAAHSTEPTLDEPDTTSDAESAAPLRPSVRLPAKKPSLEEALATGRASSSADLARELGVSEATVLRRLRELTAEGVVQRTGAGKNTRYALR